MASSRDGYRADWPLAYTFVEFDRQEGMWHCTIRASIQAGMVSATKIAMSFCSSGGGIRRWHRPLKHCCAGPNLHIDARAMVGMAAILKAVEMVACNFMDYSTCQTSRIP